MERLLGSLVLSKLEMSSEIILADSLTPLFYKKSTGSLAQDSLTNWNELGTLDCVQSMTPPRRSRANL